MVSEPTKGVPIPWLSRMEDRVLRTVRAWEIDYEVRSAPLQPRDRWRVDKPTTDRASKAFRIPHNEMLRLLNALEQQGLLRKSRRLSAGPTGNGYDGSLYSEITTTDKGREALSQYP